MTKGSSTEEVLAELDELPARVKQYFLDGGITDEEQADVLGTLNSVVTQLGEIKRTFGSEMEDGTRGSRYRVRVGRRATRSYSNRLLSTLAVDGDQVAGLYHALASGALKLTWNWSKLQQHAARFNANLSITGHEVLPDDAEADVGVVWGDDSPRYEAIDPA